MRRRTAFAVAGVLGLAAITPVLIGSATAAPRPTPGAGRAQNAIATGAVSVGRDAGGRLRFVGTRPGHALATSGGTPGADGAKRNLADFAPLFGVTDPATDLAVVATTKVGARSVSRFQQTHGGLPVIGGQLVVTDDGAGNLVAINGAAGDVSAVDTHAGITAARAATLAETSTARIADVATADLAATAPKLSVFDPKLLGAPDPLPARAVYQVMVTDPAMPALEQYVLVNAATGHIDLTFSQSGVTHPEPLTSHVATPRAHASAAKPAALAPGSVSICDFGGTVQADPTCPGLEPIVSNPGSSPVTEVADAYNLLTAVGTFYHDVLGRNGIDNANLPVVASVRYCPDAPDCPYLNSYWNGSQLVFGADFSNADDVVGHEYTHAVTQYTSGLLYYYQSGSINESMSDVLGEMFDQYYTGGIATVPGDDGPTATSEWLVGEDLSGFPQGLRNMSDPSQSATGAQPASTSDAAWIDDEFDAGGVHTDSGVGNKAAYLMAIGGTFNGVTVGGMPVNTVQKTAAIWLGADQLLTPGALYSDLGNALNQSCANLLAANADGLTAADCASVSAAVSATQMATWPTHSPVIPQASNCGTQTQVNLFTDNFNRTAGTSLGTAWTTAGSPYISADAAPSVAAGNAAYIPDPFPDTAPTTRYAYTTNWVTLSTTHTNYLYFRHLDSFDWFQANSPEATPPGGSNAYYEGGFVDVLVSGTTTWVTLPGTWSNGPNKIVNTFNSLGQITGTWPGRAFGGDSRGWTSSRAAIASTLNGKQVKFRFRLQSDGFDYGSPAYGWWLDDVSVNNCVNAPLAPTSVVAKGYYKKVTMTWAASSTNGGSAIKYYAVYQSSPGKTPVRTTLPATARSYTWTGLTAGVDYTIMIRAENSDLVYSPYVILHLLGTKLTAVATPSTIAKGASTKITGMLVETDTAAPLPNRVVTFYYRKHGTTTWTKATATTTISATGTYSFTVKPSVTEDYYIAYPAGSTLTMGADSPVVTITVN